MEQHLNRNPPGAGFARRIDAPRAARRGGRCEKPARPGHNLQKKRPGAAEARLAAAALALVALVALVAALAASPRAEAAADFAKLEKVYAQQAGGAAKPFSAERGKAFWFAERDAEGRSGAGSEGGAHSGDKMNCATCHGQNLKQAGKHNKSGKRIEPMAASVNPERYTDFEKIEKWFTRNCKQVLRRECTAQEKGDVLRYLAQF